MTRCKECNEKMLVLDEPWDYGSITEVCLKHDTPIIRFNEGSSYFCPNQWYHRDLNSEELKWLEREN